MTLVLAPPQHELQLLIGGSQRTIDVHDWRANTLYAGGYHERSPQMQWFWKVRGPAPCCTSRTPRPAPSPVRPLVQIVAELSDDHRAKLLRFVTSCSRPPLLGFAHLHPKLCIQHIPTPSDDARLPTSATCMNLLKLPAYSSEAVLRAKLLLVIESDAGFELT